ncbi:hypothetical protein [Rhizobacter sp. SG703]|uniref:hypothetical protein n=1 Tax=Rhizobacter sp. SG703 TaxID=2587140 RepID=UPI0014458B17|nr:hypothetical protein [Rhizobacter sp. SG703]NKI97930.1 hypothetical protein [Rhizobacter sp. SG703]
MENDSPSAALRLGACLLAALVGLALGFVPAIAFAAASVFPSVPFAVWVFGTSVILGAVSYLAPSFAFALFPAVAHMFAGAAKQAAWPGDNDLPGPEPSAPSYLKVAFYAGAVALVVIVLIVKRSS